MLECETRFQKAQKVAFERRIRFQKAREIAFWKTKREKNAVSLKFFLFNSLNTFALSYDVEKSTNLCYSENVKSYITKSYNKICSIRV